MCDRVRKNDYCVCVGVYLQTDAGFVRARNIKDHFCSSCFYFLCCRRPPSLKKRKAFSYAIFPPLTYIMLVYVFPFASFSSSFVIILYVFLCDAYTYIFGDSLYSFSHVFVQCPY